jgi:NodT family efflux transporter outer membrane factor (OMF) lipoprotein
MSVLRGAFMITGMRQKNNLMVNFSKFRTATAFLLMVICAYGCTKVGPDYIRPEPQIPDQWHQDLVKGMVKEETNLQKWWSIFEDDILDNLIEKAKQENKSLKAAYARINESRQFLSFAKGERFPDLRGSGQASRQRVGDEFSSPLVDNPDNFYSLGVSSIWEIDFWGRIRRSIESQEAGLEASIENYRDVMVILYAEIASNYVQVRTLQARIRYVQKNIESQRNTLKVTQDRLAAEISPALDVYQAELNLSRTESFLPPLKSQLSRTIHRIEVLAGQNPGTLQDLLMQPVPIPKPSKEISIGIPSELLRHRPDIRRAERELAQQTARIGVVTAELYPRLTLFGNFGFEATSDLFDGDSRFYGFGPSFRWNIFNAGRIRSLINVEDARADRALAIYEQTVLKALEEVESAMVAFNQEQNRRNILIRSVDAAKKSVDLVDQAYRIGLTNFLNLLDMERSLAEQQDRLASSEGNMIQFLVALYKALGGGWSPTSTSQKEQAQTSQP